MELENVVKNAFQYSLKNGKKGKCFTPTTNYPYFL